MPSNKERQKLSAVKIGKSVALDPITWAMEKNTKRKVPILPFRFAYRDNDKDVEIAIGLRLDHMQQLHAQIEHMLLQQKHLLH